MDEITLKRIEAYSENQLIEYFLDFNKKNAQSVSIPEMELSHKKRLLSIFLQRMSQYPGTRVTCLESVRILTRDKKDLDELFNKEVVCMLINWAGLAAREEEIAEKPQQVSDPKVSVEALKSLCNLIYNSATAKKILCQQGCVEGLLLRLRMYSDPDMPYEVKFFDMRMLFLMTALCAEIRPRVRTELHGLIYLMEALDLILKDNLAKSGPMAGRRTFNKGSRRGRSHQEAETCLAACLTDEEVDMACEILKILFNLTVRNERFGLEEEEEAHYLRLASILHDILLSDTKTPEKRDYLISHTVDLLTNMPVCSYEELMTPVVKMEEDRSYIYDGMDMEAISVLIDFLEMRMNKPKIPIQEAISPVLTALNECARANSTIRKFLRKKILPPLKDVMKRPEQGSALRNRLVKLMTCPNYSVQMLVADLLFVLCKENVRRLIKYTGYGNAAGLLANRGLLHGGNGRTDNYSSESEDTDTEEFLQHRDNINPMVGCYQEPQPSPFEGLTEEQKEFEAMQLVNMLEKLTKEGVIQPGCLGPDGKPQAVEHILQLRESSTKPASEGKGKQEE
ncbi:hypothetical protein CDAR_367022 [Caerostris darwini]|uniref:Synembryn-A n=1 Tax=Caerostris darwini TaxID=1538125 RepID=A0AAV4WMN9_9ARAC|nr:hypothetical protein CDAR_367022 [Caerostris darwini]